MTPFLPQFDELLNFLKPLKQDCFKISEDLNIDTLKDHQERKKLKLYSQQYIFKFTNLNQLEYQLIPKAASIK